MLAHYGVDFDGARRLCTIVERMDIDAVRCKEWQNDFYQRDIGLNDMFTWSPVLLYKVLFFHMSMSRMFQVPMFSYCSIVGQQKLPTSIP